MIEIWQLQQRQSMPLEAKIIMTQQRIKEWYEYWDGNVYVAFSGGKDSTVLLHLVRQLYPNVPAVFANTGLEYPEIVQFVRQTKNVLWRKPKMNFRDVLTKYGYPIISKEVSLKLRQLHSCPVGSKTHTLRMTGIDSKGNMTTMGKLPTKWNFLIDAPFKISETCCDIMKKNPFKLFEKENKSKPYIGMMASDSRNRKMQYLKYGCSSFEGKIHSNPMSFWLERDVWEYIKLNNVHYSTIYDMGYKRTGCSFCCFGIAQEKYPNRFQLMKSTHPRLYKYCMEELDLDKVLTYCKIGH